MLACRLSMIRSGPFASSRQTKSSKRDFCLESRLRRSGSIPAPLPGQRKPSGKKPLPHMLCVTNMLPPASRTRGSCATATRWRGAISAIRNPIGWRASSPTRPWRERGRRHRGQPPQALPDVRDGPSRQAVAKQKCLVDAEKKGLYFPIC